MTRNWGRRKGNRVARGGGGIGFGPAKGSRNLSYTARGVRFAGCRKTFCGPGENAGFVLARKLGRARILAGIFAGRAFCGVC